MLIKVLGSRIMVLSDLNVIHDKMKTLHANYQFKFASYDDPYTICFARSIQTHGLVVEYDYVVILSMTT